MTLRNRELLNLFVVGIITSLGFASVYIARQEVVSTASLSYALFFFGLYVAAHVVARVTVPQADPYLLPLAGLLTAFGVTEIYRLNPDNAFRQGLWIVVGVAAFSVTLILLRHDFRRLDSYKYICGVTAIGLLVLPALPLIGQTVNGARLWVKAGPLQFQPGELAKIFLIVFLAGYLQEKREVLAQGRLKDFGPLLAIWGAAMLVLVETNDLGSALLYFGIFLAMLYVATAKAWFAGAGLALFLAGATVVYHLVGRVETRVTIWLHPWSEDKVFCAQTGGMALRQDCDSFQLVKSLYSIGNGGFGGKGFGKGTFSGSDGKELDPVPEHGLHLLRPGPGARARRRRRAAARLHAVLPARLPDRDARAGRVLQAARPRADLRLRAPDVHHRRRGAAGDPADRDHAPVRQLRRIEHRRQLRPARRPAPGLEPRERDREPAHGGSALNRQITKVAVVALILLASLMVATTYWQAYAAPDLADKQDNSIQRVARVHRQAR